MLCIQKTDVMFSTHTVHSFVFDLTRYDYSGRNNCLLVNKLAKTASTFTVCCQIQPGLNFSHIKKFHVYNVSRDVPLPKD